MPVPLAQIPNAPQLGPDPAMIGVPNANANLSGVARNLMTPGMQPGAFDGAARGMASVGNAIAGMGEVGVRIGDIIRDAQDRKQKFQDDVSIATYNRMMTEEFAKYQGTLQGKSEDQWQPGWQEHVAQMGPKLLAGLPLSENGQQRLAVDNQQFLAQTNSTLITSSNRSAVERGTGEMVSHANRQFDSGDDEGGRATVSKLVTDGAWRQDQADSFLKGKKDVNQGNELTEFMQSNAVQFADDMKVIRNGKDVPPHLQEMVGHYFSGPDGRMKIDKWEGEASRYAQGVQVDTMNEVMGRMAEGETFDEDQIRTATDGKVDAIGIATLAKASIKNPKYIPEKVSTVRTMLVNYDGDGDKDMSQWMAIQNKISESVPTEMQATFRGELEKEYARSRDGKPRPQEAELRSAISSRVDTYAKSELFGPTGMGTKTGDRGKIVDQVASDKVWSRAEQVKLDFDSWMKTHPGASPEDASKWLNGVVNSDLMKSARNELDASGASAPWPLWVANPGFAMVWNMRRDPSATGAQPKSDVAPKTDDLNSWRASKPLGGSKPNGKKSLDALKKEADDALLLPTNDGPDITSADPDNLIPISS